LIYSRREKLKVLTIQPEYVRGFGVILSAAGLLLVGDAGGLAVLEQISLVVMIAGLVFFLLGKMWLMVLGFPIAYLFFMVPIADELIIPLHQFFQILTAKAGVSLLQFMGFAALLKDQYIFLPNITLEVAKACSGINYLISVLAVGVALASLTLKNMSHRIILVLSALVIGVIANWIRVVAIGIWSYYGVTDVLHGPFHVFQALFVSQVGFVALFVGAWLLNRIAAPEVQVPSGVKVHHAEKK